MAFDGGSRGSSLSDSVREIQAQAKVDDRTPVPSTTTSSNELDNFWENLEGNSLDRLCRNAQIQLNQNATIANVIGIGGGLKRYLKSFPNQRLSLVDEIQLKLSASIGQELLQVPNYGSLSVGISGGMEGTSIVVRPLEDTRYCKQLGTLAKLYEAKTVLPINAQRISGMENGEIWKLPMVVRYSIRASVGATFNGIVTVSIGGAVTKERKPMISLYRIDDNNLRLRLRLDHVNVKTVGASANTIMIPAGDIGLLSGEDLLARTLNRTLAHEINKMLAFKLAYSHVRTTGQKLLVEFHINPNNAEQVARLAEFLDGDLSTLRKFIEMGLKFDTFAEEANGQSGVGDLEQLGAQTGSAAGTAPAFTGSDHYTGHSDNSNINIPVIYSQDNTWASNYHRYQSLNNGGATIHVQQRTRVSRGDSFNIPFIGTQVKHNSQKDISVVNRESADGAVTRPVLLFQKYEGFMRQGDSMAREMIDNVNGVLKYAGMQGNGVNMDNTFPSAGIFPPLPPQEKQDLFKPGKTYRAAVMAFKLVFAEKAVQDIIFAPAQLILKSFMNVMREKEGAIIDKVMDLFTINTKGKVDYNYNAVRKRLGVSAFNNNGYGGTNPLDIIRNLTNPLDIVKNLASAATKFIEKIASVRNESTWRAQAERLSKVASSGDMKYEDFLKVVIQLVSPKDISSSLYIHTDKHVKGEVDVTQTYNVFNSLDNNFDSAIADVTEMRERFSNPSTMTD